MSKYLQKLKKVANNEFSFIANEENNLYVIDKYHDSGCYILNGLLSGTIYGGIVDGRRYQIAGPSSVAKSYLTSLVVKSYLEQNEDSCCVAFESEGSTILEMVENFGISKDRFLILPVKTIESCRSQSLNLLKEIRENNKGKEKRDKFIFLYDSIGNLSTNKEIGDIEENSDKKDMTRAQLLRGFGRALSLEFLLAKVPAIIVNHSYSGMSQYEADKTGGGEGPKYLADCTLILSKSKERVGSDQVGVKIKVKVEKGRFTKENIFGNIIIHFSKGLYKYSDLVDKAYEFGVFKKEGISFILPDGNKVKMAEVRKNFKEYANETNMNAIDEAIQKHFKFGQEIDDTEFIDDVDESDEE